MKRMWKRAISLLLALVMLCSMMPMTAFAAEETEANPWSGRSAVFVGDSITAGSGTTKKYFEYLAQILELGSATGMGIGGSCISSGSDYGNKNTPLINRYKDIPSADLIQIFMGTNDYGHATPIGSPEDTQAGTFYGALNTIIPYLLETHKESKIVFVTPLHRNAKSTGTTSTSEYDPNASGHTLHDYVEAIEQVCATHGVSVIDLYTESEMDPRLDPKNTAYFPDGLHPNAAGHELIAGIMESHIREYEPVKIEPIVQAELIQGNKFSASNDQPCRASSRVNYYLKAGTVITLKNPDVMQWACAKTNGEISSTNLGYFPESQWTDKETAVVAEDGWVGFVFKYRDETQVFDLSKPLSEYITIEEPHTHSYKSTVTAPTCTEQGYTTYTCACGDSYVDDVSMDITDRFKWNEGYVISAFNGNMMADKNWVASDYVDISAFESIEIVTGDTVNANTTLGIAFYDANKKFVSGVVHTDKTGTEYGILVHNLEVPQGVSYLRTTWYSVNHGSYNGATLHTFYCKGAGTAIPPLGHDYVLTEETKPNCSAGGTKVYICSRCGESTQETTSKGDHAYDNGICIGCGSSILGNDWIAPNFAEGDYSMVVLPDTQKLVTSWEDTYYEQMQWIADNEDALNIQAVLHMGDMVDNNTAREWTICEAGTDILQNAGIPWMPMRGNHDDADYFNNYYDYTTYGTNQSWFGGAYHPDKLEHTYWFVTVGQREYMILSLGWAPSWDVLAWAQDIVEAHSDKNVILTCHAYMNSDGTLLDSSDAHCPSSYHPGYPDGDDVWDAFKGYENVVLAMGGHIHSANIVTFVDQNGTGRDVTSLLVDRQNDDMANHYGMVAVLTFHNGSNTVDVNWYSVRYDALYRAKNQFSIDVPHVHSHEYVADITVPTCTERGYTTYTCDCGESYVADYVDALGHTHENGICTICGAEDPDSVTESLSLRYDDHYDVAGKTVEILDAGTPTSCQVGYGVEENKVPDTAVVALEGNYLVATGIGTAKVKIDGILHEVTVEAAPISLLLLIGQSNMRGSEGNANQSIVCPEGMVYATYGDDRGESNTAMTVSNAARFAPSALTGEYSKINMAGTTDCLSGYPVYSLTEDGAGKIGPDSGFAYEWVRQTGEKVWVVNAAHGGTSINVWQPGTTEYEQCQALFTACQETLRKEIAAGHYTLSHMAYFWCQGCSDRVQSAQWYVNKYLAMHNGLKTEMSFDHDTNPDTADKTFEFGGIIPVRVGSTAACYRDGVYTVSNPYAYHESFVDLRFSGPRAAQYWMINNPELSDIWGVCDIGDDWVWMPDGTNGVSAYFQAHYPNGRVDYTTQVTQKESWYTPTTPAAVHDSIHYNQIGYNEYGREAVRNALIMLDEIQVPEVTATVKLLSWDGYTEATGITASTTGHSGTLVVPKVYPIWKSKEVSYDISEGLSWNYYDLLAADAQTEGTLTAGGQTVYVAKAEPGVHYVEHLSQLPADICCGLNLWPLLEHDSEFYYGGTHWAHHGTKDVCSVTIPVNPGERIFATAFGKAGENGHTTSNGIRVTFFSEYGVAKTLAPAECYAEFTANGGYLTAPVGTTAVNIAMWNNSDDNEIYLIDRAHDTDSGICGICGKDSHTHKWSDWEMKGIPGKGEPITEERICSGCGETETREVESVWQKYDLAAHYSDLPEKVCSGLNLWNILEHDKYYFASGTNWAVYSSGDVCSVTIPVNPGDRIFATAFGKAGENGHATSNGIRVTFFSVYGVAKTMTPAECYTEFSANGGCLIVPENAIAINVAMWNDSDENELYIQNRDHTYKNGICSNCGATIPNPYAGKTIACVGDSITYGVGVTRDETDYVTLLARSLEMDYIRLGASGTTLCAGGHATCNIGKLAEGNLAGADVVTILMGINDFVQAKNGYYSLGTIDSTDTSTIYGAVRMWCQRIQELRATESLKDTEFYFMTPVITSWNNSVSSVRNWDQEKANIHGYTLRDLCNAIIEVCALYDIPVIDLNLVSGLYYNSGEDNTVAEFGGDGAHPGTVGHQMMAEAIKHALLKDNLRNDHDHLYGSWITTTYPGCYQGEQKRVCAVCSATESRKLDALGHTYENGICSICGAADPDYHLPGDINADKTVNNKDLTRLFQYLSAYDVEVVAAALDLNGDGRVNNKDLTRLFRYLSGWDVALQ